MKISRLQSADDHAEEKHVSIKWDLEEEGHHDYVACKGLEEGIFGKYPKVWNQTGEKKNTNKSGPLFLRINGNRFDSFPFLGDFHSCREKQERRIREEEGKEKTFYLWSIPQTKKFPCFLWALLLITGGRRMISFFACFLKNFKTSIPLLLSLSPSLYLRLL